MDLTVVKGGKFNFTIGASHLAKGLRVTKRNPRNSDYLVESAGAVGKDGVLQSIDSISRIATATITDGFPFPQVFVFTNMIIVCGLKKIYEWVSGSLVLKYTATEAGGTWSAVDFYDYVYMSNGKIAVIRDAGSYAYSLSSAQPHATAICNFNGQVMIGAPDVDGLGASIVLPASSINVTTSQLGTMTTT
jgi:hypothetical protein